VSASVQYDSGALREDNQSVEFNKVSSLRFGLEAELIFPYTNKWSVFIEPTYTLYNSKQELASAIDESNLTSVEIDYRFIEVPLGLRHQFFFWSLKSFS
jgi:hypothetical protein